MADVDCRELARIRDARDLAFLRGPRHRLRHLPRDRAGCHGHPALGFSAYLRQLVPPSPAFTKVASVALIAVLGVATLEQLLTYVVFAGWIFHGLGAAAVFSYRRRDPAAPFRTPGYPWTTLLFVLAAPFIVVNTFLTQPREALVGAGIGLLEVPAYLFWRKP